MLFQITIPLENGEHFLIYTDKEENIFTPMSELMKACNCSHAELTEFLQKLQNSIDIRENAQSLMSYGRKKQWWNGKTPFLLKQNAIQRVLDQCHGKISFGSIMTIVKKHGKGELRTSKGLKRPISIVQAEEEEEEEEEETFEEEEEETFDKCLEAEFWEEREYRGKVTFTGLRRNGRARCRMANGIFHDIHPSKLRRVQTPYNGMPIAEKTKLANGEKVYRQNDDGTCIVVQIVDGRPHCVYDMQVEDLRIYNEEIFPLDL